MWIHASSLFLSLVGSKSITAYDDSLDVVWCGSWSVLLDTGCCTLPATGVAAI